MNMWSQIGSEQGFNYFSNCQIKNAGRSEQPNGMKNFILAQMKRIVDLKDQSVYQSLFILQLKILAEERTKKYIHKIASNQWPM
jgi:hypothetical protein